MENVMERIKKILAATDYSEDARRAETRASMLSVELKAETLEMMAVQGMLPELRDITSVEDAVSCQETVAALMGKSKVSSIVPKGSHNIRCIRSVRAGKPAAAIVARASEMQADLIVVASRRKKFFSSLFGPHPDDELVRTCNRPVLLVKAEPGDAYKNVLVAVDFSEASRDAARLALLVAPSAHVTFLHVFYVPNEGMMHADGVSTDHIDSSRVRAGEMARGELNQFIAELGERKQLVTRAVQHGQPLPVICEYAKRLRADLIVVGKHGKSHLDEFLVGSITRRLLDQTSSDLLIAPTPEDDDWDDRPAA